MYAKLRSSLWRFTSSLLLIALVFAPLTSIHALAAPVSQEPEPQAALAPGDHIVTNIVLGPDTPNILAFNSRVTLTFKYSTTEPDGVRIFIVPFTDGNPTPNLADSPSPIYPTATDGDANGFFTVTSGAVVVDQVQIRITTANQSALLFEAYLPVHYQFGDPTNLVTNIILAPDNPDVLKFNQNVDISFLYSTRYQQGVKIWFRPFTNGALTPNYGAHGSPTYPPGTGNDSAFFTIQSRQVVVDQIRVQMWNADETVLLFEAFLPVYFRFRDPTNIVTHVELSPDTPNIFKYKQEVNLTFNYTTNYRGGVQIFARPFSGANLSPDYGAHGSDVYFGSGSATGSFTLLSGPTVVDKVRIQMKAATPDHALLFEAFLPVSLFWAGEGPPPGPDMRITRLEVTQGTQDLNNSVDLVAKKQTYVRMHVSAPVSVHDVTATLKGKRGFITLNPILNPGNPGGDITVRPSPDRGQLNDSFWFELPSSWTEAGNLTLTARLDPNNAKNDQSLANNTLIETVNFKTTPAMLLRIFNVQYKVGATTHQATNTDMNMLESWLRRAYPIHSLQVSRQTFVYPDPGLPAVDTLHSWLALTKLFAIIFSGENPRTVYYGMVDDGGGFMRGKALGIPSTIAAGPTGTDNWGWDYDGSYGDWYGGHEIGHTRGRYHAEFCGAGGGIPYPYPNGRISPVLTGNTAIYGFDITSRTIYPPTWTDVMTYCDNEWMSDYTYEGIRSYIVSSAGSSPELAQSAAGEHLIVIGSADLDSHTASLENVQLIQQAVQLPLPIPGKDWSIVLVGLQGDLSSYQFSPNILTDSEETPGTPAVISEVVPWEPGTIRVEIRYQGQPVASRNISAHAPTVNLTAPLAGSTLPNGLFPVTWTGDDQDGDQLTYSVLYSNDGGATWQTMAVNLSGNSLQLDGRQLPGGSDCQIRVIVTDGFLTGEDVVGKLTVPRHAPSAQILLPNPDQVFFPTQPVTLQGTAYDLEDGTISDDTAFAWSSSIDGDLGSGATLITSELSAGTHEITLVVTDSNGMSSQAQVKILIGDELAVEAASLSAAPFSISVVVDYGSAPTEQPLTLHSSGDVELDWSASESLPWLSLSAASGQTPSDLVLTFTPGKLGVGSYTGAVTFNAAQPGISPTIVNVSMQIVGRQMFLPVIRRLSTLWLKFVNLE